jgi:hypothetical protein
MVKKIKRIEYDGDSDGYRMVLNMTEIQTGIVWF